MRFRFLLWQLGRQLASASRRDGEFRRHLYEHQLIFQLRSRDGRVARHFLVADQRILPLAGSCPFADLDVVFSDDRWGCRALNPRSRHQAFFEGVDA